MPKIEIDYSKTIMYKLRHITDINNTDIYIGHTTNFSKRKAQHKSSCNKIIDEAYYTKKYETIRSKGGWEEWEMLPIELYPCSNKIEACIREEYWKNHYNSHLNSYSSHQTKQERSEYKKEYLKEYYPVYYQENKEQLLTQKKEYYEANKEQISAYVNEKITCECGCILARTNIQRHRKNKKHLELMEKINKNISLIIE
jgi:hypothetical protein